MKSGTAARATASQNWADQHSAVKAYIHRDTAAAWLDVAGPISPPSNPKILLGQLRRAHRRLPRGIDRIGVDLTRLDELTIELAVVLCLESRMLSVRDTPDLASGRRSIGRTLSRAAANARLGENGWHSLAH